VKIIYLDQNKWIDLSRADLGLKHGAPYRDALASLVGSIDEGKAVCPLSATHYLELARVRDVGRRERLGRFMWRLSGGQTFVATRELILYEIDLALSKWLLDIRPTFPTLISRGVEFALGQDVRRYRLPDEYRSAVQTERIAVLESQIQELIEQSVLTGGFLGIRMPPFRESETNEQFVHHLRAVHEHVLALPAGDRDAALVGSQIMDIAPLLYQKLEEHSVPLEWLRSLGREGLRAFLEYMPSRRLDLHLHRQWLRNPQLRPKHNDLLDWAGLGPAATYCDVLVCERHFGELLRRDGFQPRAVILNSVRDLEKISW
jgi:hypothetical protein